MKKILFIWAMALFVISCDSGKSGDKNDTSLTGSSTLSNSEDTVSYAIGNYYSKLFQNLGVKIEATEMATGLKEALEGESYMNDSTIQSMMLAYQMEIMKNEGNPFTEEKPLNMSIDSLAYAMGANLGTFLETMEMNLNPATFLQGAADFYEEGASILSEELVEAQVQKLEEELQRKQEEQNAKQAEENIEKGKQFIAEKAKEAGVKSTSSGLHYKVLREGSGPNPKATDKVKVHYHGTLIDGTVFDSSVDRGTPIEFNLDAVIKGWTEGLQLMKPNAKFQFYIPADLAYGGEGSGPLIGPGATLVFDIELLEIK